MNKEVEDFIKKLKEIINKKLENYELDKVYGQLSPESIYCLFPTESKLLLDYINFLEANNRTLRQRLTILSVKPAKPTDSEILQSRIDEAVKYIKEKVYGEEDGNFVVAIGEDNGCPEEALKELLSILERGKE